MLATCAPTSSVPHDSLNSWLFEFRHYPNNIVHLFSRMGEYYVVDDNVCWVALSCYEMKLLWDEVTICDVIAIMSN
jgi:hypothetical protein